MAVAHPAKAQSIFKLVEAELPAEMRIKLCVGLEPELVPEPEPALVPELDLPVVDNTISAVLMPCAPITLTILAEVLAPVLVVPPELVPKIEAQFFFWSGALLGLAPWRPSIHISHCVPLPV